MASTTSTTSYTKTPQATDDSYAFSEDALTLNSEWTLDVMSNDLGGKAKVLWSLDGVEANAADYAARDMQGTTSNGNMITISGGKITYKVLNTFDYLAAGETGVDTFQYQIKLANGTISIAEVSIVVTGTNDAAVITGDIAGSAAETNAPVTISGVLTATDVDNDDGFQAETIGGTNGSLSINTTGSWTFTANSAFDSLNVGDKVEETFTVKSVDGTEQAITVTINGTNDAAVITGASTGSA
ncbi:VCBS domain-containing protein, partial [Perlucidibaca piscinae]|uniref:VCBS domain-containing protein n=1 Tax=Perlucidibaca piscinae TaxID=392589 RepID=UPI0004789CDB